MNIIHLVFPGTRAEREHMKRISRSALLRVAAIAIAGGLVMSGCASGSSSVSSEEVSNAAGSTGAVGIQGNQGDGGQPVPGGTFVFASLAPVASLDPTKTQATGATGSTELAAIYDVLIRYDAGTGSFEPQLAKSLTDSADGLTWTLKLRDGVTFSDGTPLDAESVIGSINRYNERRGAQNEIWTSSVAAMTAPDPSTVEFTLKRPWAEFSAMLTFGHGMIVAPASDAGEQFTPIGAGAFTLVRLAPQEELTMTAREDYWGGKPHLDGLRFVALQGEQTKLDTLRAGGINAAYLNQAETVEGAKAEFPGYAEFSSLGQLGQINNRPGHPGSDVRVRQAMAYAIDTDALDQRVRDGKGMPGTEIFQPWSAWHNDVAPISPNTDKARELLEAAKNDGYDGHISYLGLQDPNGQATALAVQAMLQAVGFDVTIDYANSSTDLVKKMYVDHDFDLARGGNGLLDPAPFMRLYSSYYSTSTNNTTGSASPEMDAALDGVQIAQTDEDKTAALADVQRVFNEQVPTLVWGAVANYVPWSVNAYGIKPSLDSTLLLDKAWLK